MSGHSSINTLIVISYQHSDTTMIEIAIHKLEYLQFMSPSVAEKKYGTM